MNYVVLTEIPSSALDSKTVEISMATDRVIFWLVCLRIGGMEPVSITETRVMYMAITATNLVV